MRTLNLIIILQYNPNQEKNVYNRVFSHTVLIIYNAVIYLSQRGLPGFHRLCAPLIIRMAADAEKRNFCVSCTSNNIEMAGD